MHICLFQSSKIDPGLMAEPPQPTHRLKWLYLHTFIPNEARSQSETRRYPWGIQRLVSTYSQQQPCLAKMSTNFAMPATFWKALHTTYVETNDRHPVSDQGAKVSGEVKKKRDLKDFCYLFYFF